ncbi:MAG: ABC transporter ATP-binding protein [Candidatus Eiseniibacteriota bacterium]
MTAADSDSDAALSVAVHAARLDYGGGPLFADLDLTLDAGRWTCLLGPSGVGKTSLLRLMAGLVDPWADSRIVCGDGRPLAGRIAYMAQQDLLLPWLSVADNVVLGARLRGERRPGIVRRALELLDMVELGGLGARLPAQLSGGQRQRAALARTLMEDRPVVLMDEPFSALDAITRLRIQDLAAALLRGRTVLLVTHDPLEALRVGDRIHVMAGRPARLGPPLKPDGAPPRDPGDPSLLRQHAELLHRLTEAREAA